jgi:serine/threonine protein phosphatase 1
MANSLALRMSRLRSGGGTLPRIDDGLRVYAIGDVHGRYDLLSSLIKMIEDDNAQRAAAETRMVLLGDYIDRGPDSAKVCKLLYKMHGNGKFICLKGNHEDVMIKAMSGDEAALRLWYRIGGMDTMRSFKIDDDLILKAIRKDDAKLQLRSALRSAISRKMLNWISALPTSHRIGDYLFTHAGIQPGIPLEDQNDSDLLWIRGPFLRSKAWHGAVVVHGHSEDDTVFQRANRIGIDTAAYRTGRLTAIGIEKADQWFLST